MESYASYTYKHPNFLVKYPHIKRHENQEELVLSQSPKTWLDYGTGDGHLFLKMYQNNTLPPSVICYEPVDQMHIQLKEKLFEVSKNKNLICISNLEYLNQDKFSLISAFGVLEHLTLPKRIEFYQFLADNLSSDGSCLIEIPVEYGPVLLLSEFGRKFLKNRKTQYKFIELIKASFFGVIEDTHNRYDLLDVRSFISPHHGFNIFKFLNELSIIGSYKLMARSPFHLLPLWCNQTAFYLFNLKIRDKTRIQELIKGEANKLKRA